MTEEREGAIMIDPVRVGILFEDCLLPNKDHEPFIAVEGITATIAMDPAKLEAHRAEIRSLVDSLPIAFHETGGRAQSFLQMCMDSSGNQWTAFHRDCEKLFLMAAGLRMARFWLPRNLWELLPGGMPYITILKKEAVKESNDPS